MTDKHFIFDWLGEIHTQSTLAIDEKVFLDLINLLIDENPNSPIFNLDKLKRSRVINKYY